MTTAPHLRDALWLAEKPLRILFDLLDTGGEEARVVGGAVRNALMDLPIGEIDIATTAVPDEVMRRAKAAGIKAVPTGVAHGTVTLVIDGKPFEVTTLREDTETFGRKAKVAFGRDWVRDAERRDFTINGLSVDAGGRVHDHHRASSAEYFRRAAGCSRRDCREARLRGSAAPYSGTCAG